MWWDDAKSGWKWKFMRNARRQHGEYNQDNIIMEQRLINGWQPSTTMKPQNDDAGIENIQGVKNPFKSVQISTRGKVKALSIVL